MKECDYLIVGAGATAMAFCDSLLQGRRLQESEESSSLPMILMVDPHSQPGGQWNDSYDFVQLHQPSAMYGVESMTLEPSTSSTPDIQHTVASQHRATRVEILDYYRRVLEKWSPHMQFIGNAKFDFDYNYNYDNAKSIGSDTSSPRKRIYRYYYQDKPVEIMVRQKVVDARFLQPDLPMDTPPKFQYNPDKIHCVPINALTTTTGSSTGSQEKHAQHYVVIGGGKTGMDAVSYLLTTMASDPASQIVWIMPNDAWITARESIGNCMEFLHTALTLAEQQKSSSSLSEYVQTSPDCLQAAFLEWERQGKVYRLDPNILPTKFKDATLSLEELTDLRRVTPKNILRGRGRVVQISDAGDLHFENGSVFTLPWKTEVDLGDTTFVHCSAGAFNYTKQDAQTHPLPVFSDDRIVIQDVYGTPGFCFVGSIIGKLESLSRLSNDEKNALCVSPSSDNSPSSLDIPKETIDLGPSGGDVGVLSSSHGFVQRLGNLRKWLQVPELSDWLVGHRLFNLGHYANAQSIQDMVEESWAIAVASGIASP